MTESLQDLLHKRDNHVPPEVAIIKTFIHEQFNASASVTVQEKQIIIAVAGASLAGALRQKLPQLQSKLDTTKRLVIRIG